MRDHAAIRRGAAENEVQKHEDKLTGARRQMSTLSQRYEKWCKSDDIEDRTHKQRYEAPYQSRSGNVKEKIFKNVSRGSKIRQNVQKYDKAILKIQDFSIYKMIHYIIEIQDLKFPHDLQ